MYESLKTHPICISSANIGIKGWNRKLQWDSLARRTVANFLDLLELNELVADVKVVKSTKNPDVFILTGSYKASFVQECVICMGPVIGNLKEDISAKFVPDILELNREDIFTHMDDDHPETYSDEMLEVGKLVQDQLSLAIGLYPRHEQPRCAPSGVSASYAELGSKNMPFAELSKLLNKKRKKSSE